MKKMIHILIGGLLLMSSVTVFGQSFPHKSIYEIQYRNNADLTAGKDRSTFADGVALGASNSIGSDTLEIVGVVVVAPRLPDGRRTFNTSLLNSNINPATTANRAATVFVVADTSVLRTGEPKFSYIFVNHPDSSVNNKLGTGTLQKGDVVRMWGRVEENTNLTKFKLLDSIKVNGSYTYNGIVEVIDAIDSEDMPVPPTVPVTYFNTGNWVSTNLASKNLVDGEAYEAVWVKMTNLKVGNIIKTNGETEVNVTDENGNMFTIDNYSTYFAGPNNIPFAPTGAMIDSMFGVIGMFNTTSGKPGMWTINPLTPADIFLNPNKFAVVSNYAKDKTIYQPSDPINLSYSISDADGTVDSAFVFYKTSQAQPQFTKLALTGNGGTYTASIPATNVDSAYVQYYVIAYDNMKYETRYPIKGFDAAWVLKNGPTIQSVQYSTNFIGTSHMVGDSVTVTGVVTSTLRNMGEVHIQNGVGPWSGILVYGPAKLDTFQMGDLVQIRGKVVEFNDKTEISYPNIGAIKILQTHPDYASRMAAVPPATLVTTANVKAGGAQSEWYESVLVKLSNVFVVVTDVETDYVTGKSRGEIAVNEDNSKTEGLRVDDISNLRNHNLPYINNLNVDYTLTAYDSTKTMYTKGQKFNTLSGILDYRAFMVKLSPRDSTDFGFTLINTAVSDVKPTTVSLDQNYPNPFNPTTNIRFTLNSTQKVSLHVYNLLGQQVGTVVNNQLLTSNTYTYQFNASSLASGMYFYRLILDNRVVETKKMMLVK